jgi:aldose 1-epimerase
LSAASTPPLLALCHGARRALIAPHVGGAIAAFFDANDDGKVHWLRPATDAALAARNPLGMASFPLLPYCNRIRDARFTFDGRAIDLSGDGNAFDHALHGHAWRRPWRVGETTESSVELHFSHEPSDAPFDHMVLYAPAGEPSLLCVEPVTNTVDWINLDAPVQHKGGCVLAPGESVSASFAWLPSR